MLPRVSSLSYRGLGPYGGPRGVLYAVDSSESFCPVIRIFCSIIGQVQTLFHESIRFAR
jgi:hypothetical protein